MTSNPNPVLSRPRRWRIPFFIFAVLALGAVAAGAAFWWTNRPIQATILTPPEKKVVQDKLAAVEKVADDRDEPMEEVRSQYVAGEKRIVLTERELNGLVHENTGLGEQLKFALAQNEVHARINLDIPQDFPIMAGKKLKGKARFVVGEDAGVPRLSLEDLTVWGISLPNAWLGDLKGQNLLGDAISPQGWSLAGVEKIAVTKEGLVIELAD